ncbi:hypothetical protein [Dysgonomonas sp. GY617]|uniref:hypothetical protein n=1 Tax=Dysgonomonas sp. GY617 TaxID=2780420 RepID=UPI0018834179|nr:hypothetical protein [Dysgonomonas sp. GY617]MBF0576619.1 hypothetical protein [Dysgonomonas sp. GY617]
MKTKRSLIVINILSLIIGLVWLPFMLVGLVLYYLSKLMRAMGFILMLKKYSASNEFAGFWQIYSSFRDYKVGL